MRDRAHAVGTPQGLCQHHGDPHTPPPPRGTDFAPGGNRRSFSPWPVGGNMVPPAPTSVLGGGAGAAPPPWMDGHGQTGAAGPALLFLKDLGPTCGVSALSVFRGPSVCVPQPHGGGCVCGGLCVPPCILPQHCCCLGASPGRLGPLPLRLPRGPPCGAPPPPYKRGGSVCVCSLLPWRGFICVPALTPPFRPPATPLAVAVGGHVASLFTSRPRPPRDSPPHAMTSVT